jgi:hypothetical protein
MLAGLIPAIEVLHPFSSLRMPPFTRSFWILLILGIAIRSIALTKPLVDAHPLRQALVSDYARSLMAQPGVPISARIPWSGDFDDRYILELPFYNYMAIGVYHLVGNLDMSGKLVTIALWAVSFALLQLIWRRFLDPEQAFWANILFVLAPLEIFFGQAFMAEMWVQVVAFILLLQIFRYAENPTLGRWMALFSAALIAVLVKVPETAHLFLILAILVFQKERFASFLRPRYLAAAVVILATAKLLSSYIDSVNTAHMYEWTSKELLRGFIGPIGARFTLKPWAMAGFYIGAFVCPLAAGLIAAYGLWEFLRKMSQPYLAYWLLSLVAYYVVWFGNAGTAQNYYNIPAVGPICALFGIGTTALLRSRFLHPRRTVAAAGIIILVAASVFPGTKYLFTPDNQILAAALWTRDHTKLGDVVIYRPNHRFDMTDHLYNPVFPYYSERPTFVWTRNTPERYRKAALERAKCAIVTITPDPPSGVLAAINRFRGVDAFHLDPMEWIVDCGFRETARNGQFVFYERESK